MAGSLKDFIDFSNSLNINKKKSDKEFYIDNRKDRLSHIVNLTLLDKENTIKSVYAEFVDAETCNLYVVSDSGITDEFMDYMKSSIEADTDFKCTVINGDVPDGTTIIYDKAGS